MFQSRHLASILLPPLLLLFLLPLLQPLFPLQSLLPHAQQQLQQHLLGCAEASPAMAFQSMVLASMPLA